MIQVMTAGENYQTFCFYGFCVSMVFHLALNFLSPFIVIPIYALLMRGDTKLLESFSFIPNDALSANQFFGTLPVSIILILIFYGVSVNELNIYDFVDFICVMIVR